MLKNLIVLCLLFSLCSCHFFSTPEKEVLTPFQRASVETLDELIETIFRLHYTEFNDKDKALKLRETYLKKVLQAQNLAQLNIVLNEMTKSFGHSHVAVLPPEDPFALSTWNALKKGLPPPVKKEKEFVLPSQRKIKRKMAGTLGVRVSLVDSKLMAIKVDPKGVAYEAGLRSGDQILHAGQPSPVFFFKSSIIPQKMWSAVFYMLTNRRNNEKIPLVFAKQDSQYQGSVLKFVNLKPSGLYLSKLGVMPEEVGHFESSLDSDKIGYIAFAPCSPQLVFKARRAIQSMNQAGMKGLVIDLRDNLGGLGSMSGALIGHLTDTPLVMVNMQTKQTKFPLKAYPQKDLFLGPVTVLINGNSASSSEIFAAAIRDNNRGIVYGKRTAGACLGSQFIEMKTGFRLQTVLSTLNRINGEEIESVGVAPHIECEQSFEDAKKGIDTVELRARNDLLEFLKKGN